MADAPRTTTIDRQRRQRRQNVLIVVGVLAVLGVALAYAAWDRAVEVPPQAAPSAKPQAANRPEEKKHAQDEAASDVIDDDGHSMWVSPTHGPPLDLAYLPPGVEIILALRPAELLANPEGQKVFAALGPRGVDAIESLERATGVSLSQVERLLVGWQVTRDGAHLPTFVVTTLKPINPPSGSFQPNVGKGRITVVAPESALADIRLLDSHAPPLARDLERLLEHTDSDRDMTLLIQPRSFLGAGSKVLGGEFVPLQDAIETLFGQNVTAAAISLDWNESFFAEALAVPTLDTNPEQLSEQLATNVQAWPSDVEEKVVSLHASPYSRRVVARLPEMVRRLAAYTRHGYDKDCAILRCYLPVTAGHNLLMAAELTLAEGQGSATNAAEVPVSAPPPPGTLAERLQKKTTLRFGREELEAALHMLSEDVGVPITIRGQDLQLDGITRNQLFAIDLSDRQAAEILVEILRRANPDKTATGPADPRQKLVYVLGPEAVVITTRSQAAARGETLPVAFQGQ